MKKAVAFATGAAMFLSAAPAFATHDEIDIDVDNDDTEVVNVVTTVANTGGNFADGGSADASVSESGNVTGDHNDDNSTSAGGGSATGGEGGDVTTGDADADSDVVNIVNSTIIRVHRH